MAGDAIRSSWDFPLLEALIFHVECLVRSNWLLCCVREAALLLGGLWLVTSEETGGESERALPFKRSPADVCDFLREGGQRVPATFLAPFNGTRIHSHHLLLSAHFDRRTFISVLLFFYRSLSFLASSGKQATHKDAEEHFESSVE